MENFIYVVRKQIYFGSAYLIKPHIDCSICFGLSNFRRDIKINGGRIMTDHGRFGKNSCVTLQKHGFSECHRATQSASVLPLLLSIIGYCRAKLESTGNFV
jgi:hypothetical protein